LPRLFVISAGIAALLSGCGGGSNAVADAPASLVEKAEAYEAEVRAEFRAATGHDAANSHELLAYIDRRVEELPKLDDTSADALVQAYGSTLGQLLIHDLSAKWVRSGSDGDGVALPNGKVAYVFNRAARRIFDREPLGFVAYYDSALSLVKGAPLPGGVQAKKTPSS